MTQALFENTAYGRLIDNRKIKNELARYVAETPSGELFTPYKPKNKILPIVITGGHANKLPAFNHPVYFTAGNHKEYMATDVRSMVRKAKDSDKVTLDGMMVVNRATDYEVAIARLLLNVDMVEGEANNLRSVSGFACLTMATLVADRMRTSYMLDAEDYSRVMVAAYLYLQAQFYVSMSQEDTRRIAGNCISTTKQPAVTVLAIVDLMPEIKGYETLVDFLKIVCPDALSRLTPTIFLNAFNNIWLGANQKELGVGALEHMPTLLALVYYGLTERSIKGASLPTTALRLTNKYNGNGFQSSIKEALVSHVADKNEHYTLHVTKAIKTNPY